MLYLSMFSGFDLPKQIQELRKYLTMDKIAQFHTFVEIDHEIIFTAILLFAESFKKGCCQLQASVST